MAFSATDAAIEGFRIAREKPLAVAGWAAVALVNGAVSSVVLVTMAGPAMQTYGAVSPADATAAMQSLQVLAPAYAVLLVLSLISYSILVASVNRVVLRPQEKGFLWLRLGADEFRQGVVLLVLGLLLFAAYMGAAVVAGVIAGVAFGGAPPGSATIAAVGLALAAAVFAFLAILAKLSLASPLTFDLGRIEIGAAWRMSQGRFGQMIGAYVLAFCMLVLVGVLLMVIYFAFASVTVGGVNTAIDVLRPKTVTLSTYFTPLRILYLLFASVISALANAIWFGVAPRAYQQLKGTSAASVF